MAISSTETLAIKLDEDHCSKCRICYSVCPFDAILLDVDTSEIRIDVEKCQVCGICASACPAAAIELAYYDNNLLIDYVERQAEALETDALVLMCRGSSPPTCEVLDVLQAQSVTKFVPLRLPCVGRLSPEFYLQALVAGVGKIMVVQCDEDFCRFKKGSITNQRRASVLKRLLEQFGYDSDPVTIIKNSAKAVYNTAECVGCDKCVFICPYDAIEAEPLATPQINLETCKGCGACALVCPHLAIQLKGFEYELSSQAIQRYKAQAENLRAKGISPIVLIFCCQWAEFSALDHLGNGLDIENAVIMEIPCFDGLDPGHVLEALTSGFDGVLAVICSDEDCKLDEGREISQKNISALQKTLNMLNLADRFEVCMTSPRYIGKLDSKLESFIARISSAAK